MDININDTRIIEYFNIIQSLADKLDEEIFFYNSVSKPLKKECKDDNLCINCYWDWYIEENEEDEDVCINCRNCSNYKWVGTQRIKDLNNMIEQLGKLLMINKQEKKNDDTI